MSFSIKKKNTVFNSSESEITKKISARQEKKKLYFSSKVMINNVCYLQNCTVMPVKEQTHTDFVLFMMDL